MLSLTLLTQAAGVFGTGVLASLSPCVYPMLPITLGFLSSQANNQNGKRSVLMYAFGQSLALFLIGILAVQLGETLGFSSQSPGVNYTVGILLLLAGVFSIRGKLPRFFDRWNSVSAKVSGRGPLASFALGASAALVASPCTSPILGGVLALMATAETQSQGLLLMLMYSSGFTLVYLLLGLGILKANRLPRSGRWMTKVHKASSFVLVLTGAYFLYLGFTAY